MTDELMSLEDLAQVEDAMCVRCMPLREGHRAIATARAAHALEARCEKLEAERDGLFASNFSYKQHLRDLIQAAKPHVKGNRLREGREVPPHELVAAIEAAEEVVG